MKRLVRVIAAVLFLAAGAVFVAQAVLPVLVKRTLQGILPGSNVSLGGGRLFPLGEVALRDLRISYPKVYDFRVRSLKIGYSPFSLIKGFVTRVEVSGAEIQADLGKRSIRDLAGYLKLGGKKGLSAEVIDLEQVRLEIKSGDLSLQGELSLQASLLRQSLEAADLKLIHLESNGFSLDDLVFSCRQASDTGNFSVSGVKYNKLKISRIASRVSLQGKRLVLSGISADCLDGKFSGKFELDLAGVPAYALELDSGEMALEAVVRDFDLGEKFKLSGKFSGSTSLRGQGADLGLLEGNFHIAEPGGSLVIFDRQMLEGMVKNIPQENGQTQEMLLESLQDYRYNKGEMNLSRKGGAVFLDLSFDSAQGKREFHLNLSETK